MFSTAGIADIADQLHTSPLVATLGVTTYVLGFAFGPLVWAPMSEAIGRRPVYLVSWFIFTIFQIPCALAKNTRLNSVSKATKFSISHINYFPINCRDFWLITGSQCWRYYSGYLDGSSTLP